MILKRIMWGVFGILLVGSSAEAFAPINFLTPHNRALILPEAPKTAFHVGTSVECGARKTGLSWDGTRANVLQLYDATQGFLAMLQNPQGQVANNTAAVLPALAPAYGGLPVDDGVRGHLRFTGEAERADVNFFVRYRVPLPSNNSVFFSAYFPFVYQGMNSVTIQDMTKQLSAGDMRLRDRIATLKDDVKSWGELDLGGWHKTSFGDIVLMLDWTGKYQQQNKLIKVLFVGARGGLVAPSGYQKSVDKIVSGAAGNDGALGLPLGVGIGLTLRNNITMGCEADCLYLCDKNKVRRMKTNVYQTEFLLLNKGMATKKHGLTWELQPYLQAQHVWKNLSARIAYQYVTHAKDTLYSKDILFDGAVINSARSLHAWSIHNAMVDVWYDVARCNSSVLGQIGLFYKLPFYGRGIIDTHTFGGQLAINF